MDSAKLDEVDYSMSRMSIAEKTALLATSRASEKESVLQLTSENFKNAKLPYLKCKRFYGEGEIRIGTSLTLNDDIYCAGFIAYLLDDTIKKTLNIMTG